MTTTEPVVLAGSTTLISANSNVGHGNVRGGRATTVSDDQPMVTDENGLAGDSELQTATLENLAWTPHYQDWLTSLAQPYLGDDPFELGSGTGDYATRWLDRGVERITLTEIDPCRRQILTERFAGDPRVVVTTIDIRSPEPANYSSMVSFNVLEHIEDDVAALESAKTLLRPGGYVCHLVPAFPFAMSRFDREIGHFRRYRKQRLTDTAREAGLVIEDVRYLNAPGLIAWVALMRLLRGRPTPGPMLRFWDSSVIPIERRVESRIRGPVRAVSDPGGSNAPIAPTLQSTRTTSAASRSVDADLTHLIPARAVDLAADDLRGGNERLRQGLPGGGGEVLAVDVRPRCVVVGECLDQHEGVGLVDAAGPLEPQVSRFGAGGGGERSGQLDELLRPLGLGLELHDDEVHRVPSVPGGVGPG